MENERGTSRLNCKACGVAVGCGPRGFGFEDTPSILSVLRAPNLIVRESLTGIITAQALIPEVISFSFVSGVDPKVALVVQSCCVS